MTTDREAYVFHGSILGTVLLIAFLHHLSGHDPERSTDWRGLIFYISVLTVAIMPGALGQTHTPATPKGPRKARRYFLFIVGLLPIFSIYLGFPFDVQPLTLAELLHELRAFLFFVAALSVLWLVWFWPSIWRHSRMRRVLFKEISMLIVASLALAAFLGAMNGWSVAEMIYVWMFMIGLLGNVIFPMALVRRHGASALANMTLLIGEWMSTAAYFSIIFTLTLGPDHDPVASVIGAVIGAGIGAMIFALARKNNNKPPAYTCRF